MKEGHYDKECEALLRRLDADAIILSVINGERGHGLSVAMKMRLKDTLKPRLPRMLRMLADDIEAESKQNDDPFKSL